MSSKDFLLHYTGKTLETRISCSTFKALPKNLKQSPNTIVKSLIGTQTERVQNGEFFAEGGIVHMRLQTKETLESIRKGLMVVSKVLEKDRDL
jgi:hypothetical protein